MACRRIHSVPCKAEYLAPQEAAQLPRVTLQRTSLMLRYASDRRLIRGRQPSSTFIQHAGNVLWSLCLQYICGTMQDDVERRAASLLRAELGLPDNPADDTSRDHERPAIPEEQVRA
jgi:hypothetical protein